MTASSRFAMLRYFKFSLGHYRQGSSRRKNLKCLA
nr:MAG TPA: hypothetical protein [Caudoviricetes sp.]